MHEIKIDVWQLELQSKLRRSGHLSSCQSQHHDDEKRALSREIIVLNNHLMEAKLTIDKLQEDNVISFFVVVFF